MSDERILVTGGAGFIGSHLVELLASRSDAPIVVFDKLTYAGRRENLARLLKERRIELVIGDLADARAIVDTVDAFRPTTIYHLAAESHVDRSIASPRPFIDSNIVGTFNLLEAVRTGHRRTSRVVHVSTDEVFGALGSTGAFSEASPYAPSSPYSASKAASDHLVRAFHLTYELDTITTYCSNNYGPRQFPEKLIPVMVRAACRGDALPVYGDGSNIRDWIHVNDHCRAILAARQAGIPGETFAVGANNERSNLELVECICDVVDQELARPIGTSRELITFVEDRAGHDWRYALDATHLRTRTAWRPEIEFTEGLRQTVQWYLQS